MLPAPLNLNRLRFFVAVADQGSVTRAAAALGISQPAITRAIHELERDLALSLLQPAGRGVVLTEAGYLLADYARQIQALAGQAERALDELRGLARGRLAIGASTTIGIYLLPELLGAYRRRYPAIDLVLDIANTRTVVERLRAHLLDVILVEGPVGGNELLSQPFRDDELVLIVAPGHRFARRGGTTGAQLATEPWIMRERGSGTREVVEQALAGARIAPRVAMELGSTEAIKRAVAAGLGIAMVPRSTIALELALDRVVGVPVAGFRITRPLTILRRRLARPSPAVNAFLALLTTGETERVERECHPSERDEHTTDLEGFGK